MTAVDVELDAVLDGGALRVVDAADAEDAAVIVSTHDFEGMPGRGEIRRILVRAAELGDVAKFAGTAESVDDALDLLPITHERTRSGDRVATMAMGEAGRHTRAIAPVYGSEVGYAPVDPSRATAPGQYDLATLRSLVDRLRSVTPEAAAPNGSGGVAPRTEKSGTEAPEWGELGTRKSKSGGSGPEEPETEGTGTQD